MKRRMDVICEWPVVSLTNLYSAGQQSLQKCFQWRQLDTETGKLLPEVLFETEKNIRDLTCLYDETSNI